VVAAGSNTSIVVAMVCSFTYARMADPHGSIPGQLLSSRENGATALLPR